MFIKIMRRTFWSWWDNISYSIFTSFTAAVNPFFIVMIASIWAFYTEGQFFVENASLFFVIMVTCIFAMPFFPTALAGYRLQSYVIEEDSINLFRVWWESLKKTFFRGLLHSIVYGAAGLGLSYSILYYRENLDHLFPVNYILIGISMWFILVLFMMQAYIVPLLSDEDYKFGEYYSISLVMTMKNMFRLLLVALMHMLFFILLTVPIVSPFLTVIPIVSYFGLVATLHHWAFMYIDGQYDPKAPLPKRNVKELFTPFKIRKKKTEDGTEMDGKGDKS